MYYYLIVILLLGLQGCLGPVKTPNITTFDLHKLPKSYPRYVQNNSVIIIAKPNVNPLFDNKKLWYTQIPYKLLAYSENQWLVRPSSMLWSSLVNAFTNSGYFQEVVKQDSVMVKADYLISTNINDMKQMFMKYNKLSYVKLEISVQIINYKTHAIVNSKRFTKKVKTRQPTAYSAVKSYNDTLAILLKEIVIYVHREIGYVPLSFVDDNLKLIQPF